MIFLLLACPARAPISPTLVPVAIDSESAALVASGKIVENTWFDLRFPLSIALPKGWEVATGNEAGGPRLTLVDPESFARIDLFVRPGGQIGPVERAGCDWTFWDDANYRVLAGSPALRAGTCTPNDPLGPRVLGYFVVHNGDAYDFEAALSEGALLAGKVATDEVLGGVRLR